MGIFRFSNAVSDINKFIRTYKKIYKELKGKKDFTHDDARDVLIEHGLVSSSGAIGQTAIKRSKKDDRSRDPLYNQCKMYSEIYRMLGWYNPGSKRTNFVIPPYGEYIFEAEKEKLKDLYEINVLHIVSPNPLVEVRGQNILRPFPLILKLLDKLDGVLHRDEIILTVLACSNDREKNYVEKAEERVRALRGNILNLEKAYENLMKKQKIKSKDTLRNYTRFILATLKYLDYAKPKRVKGIYGNKKVNVYIQTEYAKQKVKEIYKSKDIRSSDLEYFNIRERAAFANYMSYHQFRQIGGYEVDQPDVKKEINKVSKISKRIINKFKITENSKILHFPFQETSKEIFKYNLS